MNQTALFVSALGAGILLATQAGVNASLGKYLGNSAQAACISFASGTAVLLAYCLLFRAPLPIGSQIAATPAWAWCGGLMGAVYVTATIMLAPKLGASNTIAAVVAGQTLAALLLDHFGLVGFPVQTMTPLKVLGGLLLVAGVVLIRKF